MSEVPRRTYAGPPIAHPAYDAAASRKTAAGGLAVGTQTRRRSIVPSCAQTRSVGTRPARMGTLVSLSLFIACVVWVYLRLMKRYHSDITPTASHLRRPTPCGRHTRVRCHCDLCDITPRGNFNTTDHNITLVQLVIRSIANLNGMHELMP